MSVSGISFLSNASLSSDGGQAASVSADTHGAFADAMAGASKPAARPAQARRDGDDDQDNSNKTGKTKAKSKDDRDNDDSTMVTADGDQAQPVATTQSTATAPAKDTTDGKAAKARPDGVVRSAQSDGAPAATDPAATATELVDPALVAPVLTALKAVAAAGQGDKLAAADLATVAPDPAPAAATQAAQQAEAVAPLTGTAALMAARAAATPVAAQTGETRAATPATRKPRDAADKTASIDSLATGLSTQTTDAPQGDAGGTVVPDASQQLADGAADRQLDLAKQGAWLDGLARDIATAGGSAGPLRFQVSPQHLGTVQVELARGADGAAVTLTASSESARAILADARPQLVAEARAQGIHIANAQVDVGSDSRSSGNSPQHEQRHDPRGTDGFSSQMGSGGQDSGRDNGRSQTRSQPIAINQTVDGRADAAASEADASAAEPADGMYA